MKKIDALIKETNEAEIAARVKMDSAKDVYIATQQEWADIRERQIFLCNAKHLSARYGIDFQ
jgi:hypothetical protein